MSSEMGPHHASLLAQFQKMATELSELRGKKAKYEAAVESIRKEFDLEFTDLKEQNEELRKSNESLDADVEELRQQIRDETTRNNQLHDLLDKNTGDLPTLKRDLQDREVELERLTLENDDLRGSVKRLTQMLAERGQEAQEEAAKASGMEDLQKRFRETQQRLEALEAERKEYSTTRKAEDIALQRWNKLLETSLQTFMQATLRANTSDPMSQEAELTKCKTILSKMRDNYEREKSSALQYFALDGTGGGAGGASGAASPAASASAGATSARQRSGSTTGRSATADSAATSHRDPAANSSSGAAPPPTPGRLRSAPPFVSMMMNTLIEFVFRSTSILEERNDAYFTLGKKALADAGQVPLSARGQGQGVGALYGMKR